MSAKQNPALDPAHPLWGLGYAKPIAHRSFVHVSGAGGERSEADIAEEVPVAFIYNGRPHVVMMATPADFEDFAVGFSLSEEIVESANAISRLDVVRYSQGVELLLTIPAAAGDALAGRGRQLVGRTGCGLCGVQTVADALRAGRSVAHWANRWDIGALWRAEAALFPHQAYNRTTGAIHAAAFASGDGSLQIVREDVGRHNALDKVIGALARGSFAKEHGFALVTSRASHELVQKAAVSGLGLLAAVSRPTDLAIRLAEAAGMTLVGLLRGTSANVYTHADQLAGIHMR